MQIRKRHIPIFTSASDSTLKYLAPTLESISNFASPECIFDVRILVSFLAPYNRRRLRHFNLPGVNLSIVDINDKVEDYRADFEVRLGDFYKEESFYPFFIAQMYPRISKAIYAECGSVFKSDIEEIYDTNISGSLIAGKRYSEDNEWWESYQKNWLGIDASGYVDCSVMLMNFTSLRKYKFEEKFTRLITGYNFDTVHPAADYFNFLSKGAVMITDEEWTFDRESSVAAFKPFTPPWIYVDQRDADLFWDLSRKTPFYEDIRDSYIEANEDVKEKNAIAINKRKEHTGRLACSPSGFFATLGDNFLVSKK